MKMGEAILVAAMVTQNCCKLLQQELGQSPAGLGAEPRMQRHFINLRAQRGFSSDPKAGFYSSVENRQEIPLMHFRSFIDSE